MTDNPGIGHNSGEHEDPIAFNYFTVEYAIKEHDYIIEQSGGFKGVKDIGMVESVLEHVQNDLYYPEFLDKVTHIVFGLNKNHAFNDGNKRSSLALSAFFLELNGHDFALKQYQHGMEEVVIWVAKSLIDKDTLKDVISFLIYDTPMNVAWFTEQAKYYRPYIEPQDQPISAELLTQMVQDWISNDMELSEATKLAVLDAITPTTSEADEENT